MSPQIADRRRQQILEASLRLVATQGCEAITMANVAAATGVSRPAVYQYFASREHILGELLINDMADLSNEIDRLVANIGDPLEQIRLWLHYSLAHLASENHQIVREISVKNLHPEHRGELMAMHSLFLTTLLSPLGQLGVSDPTALGNMVVGAVNSAAGRILAGSDFSAEANVLERFVLAGITAAR